MSVVVLDPAEFRVVKPQFAGLSDAVLEYYFSMACGVIDNTDKSVFPYKPDNGVLARKHILYALLCHLLTMNRQEASGQAGPVSSASEGSVSLSFAVPPAGDKSFYSETACGRAFLALIRPYALGGRVAPASHYHPWG
jgi:hypothetical protein